MSYGFFVVLGIAVASALTAFVRVNSSEFLILLARLAVVVGVPLGIARFALGDEQGFAVAGGALMYFSIIIIPLSFAFDQLRRQIGTIAYAGIVAVGTAVVAARWLR